MSETRLFGFSRISMGVLTMALAGPAAWAAQNRMITDVPDYAWHSGCFGTATGNLMGFWDRNGFPDFYTGPTNGGLAPLNSNGTNRGIRSMWASRAGFDGRPADQPGHKDNYWEFYSETGPQSYESAATDPFTLLGREEHEPDCLGDFMGASQNKWTDMNGECNGNIDAFAFCYWDKSGDIRWNFEPPMQDGEQVRDVQSGMRRWTEYRGYGANVFSQLVDFNPEAPEGTGFTFADLKADIDAGYPVVLMLQNPGEYDRTVFGVPGMNPNIHAMLAYGYVITDTGDQAVRYRDSWAGGDARWRVWGPGIWEAQLALRGVIGFRPLPRITGVEREGSGVRIAWDGPSAAVLDVLAGSTEVVHGYVIEKAATVTGPYEALNEPTTERELLVAAEAGENSFYRVRLVEREPVD